MFSKPSDEKIEPDTTEAESKNTSSDSDSTNKLEDIHFSEADIIKAIDSMPNHSAPGPDKFPSIVLKQCKHELATPLYNVHSVDT